MRIPKWAYVVGAVVVVGGIASLVTPDQPAATPAPRATVTQAAPTSATPDVACLPVSDELAQQIIGEHQLLQAQAVQAEGGNYFIAVQFTPQGDSEPAVGVWQSLTLDGGPFRTVDAWAKQYTAWPDSGNAGAAVVDEAKACIR